jgi:hypothetical protein
LNFYFKSGFSLVSSESFESSACNIVLLGPASSAGQDFVCKESHSCLEAWL